MFALINHISLHYQIDGQPHGHGVPLVFINSLGCDLRIWEHVIQPFQQDFRIIRYDKRGHGQSDTPTGPYTIRDHSNDLAALLAELDVNQAILIGISVGGLIAMDLALAQPALVQALVLCDTAPKIGTTETWNERIQAVHTRGLDGIAGTILSRWFTPSYANNHPLEYQDILKMLSLAPTEGYIATCAALRDSELRAPILRTIPVPTLVLVGAEDETVSPKQTREWAAHLPQARVEVIANAAHLICIEQPEATSNLIVKFLREDCHAWR